MKCGGLGIPDPRLLAERAYNTSKSASEVPIGLRIGGTDLKYVAHKYCVRISSVDGWKQREFWDTKALTRSKELADGAGLNRLR